jgi:hypothetical protein
MQTPSRLVQEQPLFLGDNVTFELEDDLTLNGEAFTVGGKPLIIHLFGQFVVSVANVA